MMGLLKRFLDFIGIEYTKTITHEIPPSAKIGEVNEQLRMYATQDGLSEEDLRNIACYYYCLLRQHEEKGYKIKAVKQTDKSLSTRIDEILLDTACKLKK